MPYDVKTVMADVFKVRYPREVIADLGFRQQAILPFLEKIRGKYGGKNYSFTILTHRGHDTQYYPEDGTLATPTAEEYKRGYLDPTNIVTRQNLYQSVISDSADSEGSLFNVLVELPRRIAKNHAFAIANHAWAHDSLGALAVCGTTSSSTTVQLDDQANTRKFFRGMIVDICTASTGTATTNGDSVTISAIDDDNKTITISGSGVTTSSAESVYLQDSHSETTPYVWNSIPTLVGTGNVHNIDTSSYPEFVSYANTNTGTLTFAKIQAMVDWIEARHEGGNKGLVMYASPEVIIKYADILLPDQRRLDLADMKKFIGGYPTTMYYSGGTIGIIPILKDNLMPTDELFLLSPDAFRLYTPAWWEWFPPTGRHLIPSDTTLGYELRFFSRGNLGIHDRSGTGKLQAITI